MKKRWLLAAVLLTSGAAHAIDEAALGALLQTERHESNMPGLRAAVHFSDGKVVQAAVGFANPNTGKPLDNTIGMPGGSTGKTFVAALTVRLANSGVLKLDDPVEKWLGHHDWYKELPNANTMTIAHLLSHSSGLRDYPATFGFQRKLAWRVLRHGSGVFTPEELIGLVADKKPLFPAGQGYRYTDAGYLVLGRAIESAAGKSYYELLQEHILTPLALNEIRPQTDSIMADTAWSASLQKNGTTKLDPRSEWTGGGLITNPTMLARFLAAMVKERPDELHQMIKGGWQDPEEPDWHYGYGLFVRNDGSAFGHGGLWPGYRTRFTHFAQSGLTIAVQTNRDGRVDLRSLIAKIEQLARLDPVSPGPDP